MDKLMEKIFMFFASVLAFAAVLVLSINFWGESWQMLAIIFVSLFLAAFLMLARQLSSVEKKLDKLMEEKKEE